MTTLAEHVLSDTFEEMEGLVGYTVNRFIQEHGGQFQDCMEYAGLAFMIAWQKYDPTQGMTFASYVRYVLWHKLLDMQRYSARRARRLDYEADPDEQHAPREFDRTAFLHMLSTDARKVVNLVLATPPGLVREIDLTTPRSIRSVLRKHLKALGWTAERIAESFQEIRRAL